MYTNNPYRFSCYRATGIITESTTLSNSTVETELWTDSVKANNLKPGHMKKFWMGGNFSTANAGDKLTVRLKIGSTVLLSLESALGNVSEVPGHVEGMLTIRTNGSSGTLTVHSYMYLDGESIYNNYAALAIDTTVVNSLVLTGQWSAANVGHIAVLDQGVLEHLN